MLKRLLLLRGSELFALAMLASIPLAVDNSYLLGLLTLLAIYGILLIGLDVTVGYLGQVNLAQAAFLGLGAYAAALSAASFGLPGALAIAMLATLLLGALLAFPALRLAGPQFALATLSFSALSTTVLNEWESLTGGAQGLSVDRPAFFGRALDASGFYWLCLILLALVWMGMRNLLASRWGRAFEALRDSPIATDAMGVGTFRHKVAGFALGSSLGGLAGGLYAFNFQYLQPQSFTYDLMVILLLGVVLGGRKSLWGAFFGASLIVLLPNLLSNRLAFEIISASGLLLAAVSALRQRPLSFQSVAPVVAMSLLAAGGFIVENTENWRRAIFALMLFSVVVGLPDGVMGFAARRLARLFGMKPAALPPASNLDDLLPVKSVRQEVMLELQDVKRHFGGVRAVDGISMKIMRGQIHGLIGPNGSGKSTAVNVISGLYAPSSGRILLDGSPLPQGSLFKVARAGVARTFQNLQLFGELSALDNVMLALKDACRTPLPLVFLGLARSEEARARSDALALLEMVGLRNQAAIRARDLTYGSQRFLEIARALARKPELLILDEPAAGLAHPDVSVLIGIIGSIRARGITTILIEHHMDVVSQLCDVVTVIDSGQVIAEGTPDEVKRDAKVVKAYLGAAEPEAARA